MQPPPPARRLTPEERLSFDIRGYMLLPEVLSPSELAALNARLDPIEQIGLRCREENPTALGVAPEGRYGRLHQLSITDGDGGAKHAQIAIGDAGQKIWAHGLTNVDPTLAAIAAHPALRPYIEETTREPVAGLISARFQWQNAESDVHDGRSPSTASRGPPPAGEPDLPGVSPMAPMLSSVERPPEPFVLETGEGAPSREAQWRAHAEQFRLCMEPRAMVFMHDIEPGGGGLHVIPGR